MNEFNWKLLLVLSALLFGYNAFNATEFEDRMFNSFGFAASIVTYYNVSKLE